MKKTSSFLPCPAVLLSMILGLPLKLHGAVPDGILYFQIDKEGQYANLDHVVYEPEAVRPYFSEQVLAGYCSSRFLCGSPFLEIRGMAVIGADLYGIEQVTGTGQSFLSKANGALVFVRVAPSLPLGNTPVGAMVWTGEKLIAAAAGTDPGKTTLLEVSPASGAGVPLNIPALNIAVGGMAFDPGAGILYATSKVTEPPDRVTLHRINLGNGTTTEVGPVSPGMFGLAWIEPLGLVGLSDRVYRINAMTAEATPIVSGPDFFLEPENRVSAVTAKGKYVLRPPPPQGPTWGASYVPVQPEVALSGGKLKLSWVSRGKSNFTALLQSGSE